MKKYFKSFVSTFVAVSLLLTASTGICLNKNFYRNSSPEPETITYANLSGVSLTPTQEFSLNNNIKAIKSGSGVTLSSVGMNTSNVANYYFLSNPTTDPRPYTGFYASISDGSKTKKVLLGNLGTGETLGSSVIDTWTNVSYDTLTLNGSDITSAIEASSDNVYANKNPGNKTGLLMKFLLTSFTKNSGTTPVVVLGDVFGSLGGSLYNGAASTGLTVYRTPTSAALSCVSFRNTIGATNYSASGILYSPVLTPSALGLWYTPVSEETGWNPNAASYTLTITKE
jgi:hypothetical protein